MLCIETIAIVYLFARAHEKDLRMRTKSADKSVGTGEGNEYADLGVEVGRRLRTAGGAAWTNLK